MSSKRRKRQARFWRDRLKALPDGAYANANRRCIASAVRRRDVGARVVMNVSAAHVPAFCAGSSAGDPHPYKNAYDLHHLGVRHPPGKKRQLVDAALPLSAGATPADVYFGAVEITGAGIRYYGDFCLVLKPSVIEDDTVLLESNSFDLTREPLSTVIERSQTPGLKRRRFAHAMSGTWGQDLGNMIACKVFGSTGDRERLLTIGQIAEGTRTDEDYIEVLRIGSFGCSHLEEVRLHSADAAVEAKIGQQLHFGPSPSLAEVVWRQRRRAAEAELEALGVPVRTVTDLGRTRS